MKVFYWIADTLACGFYRGQMPAAALSSTYGWETLASRTMPDCWLDSDVIVGQRICIEQWQLLAKRRDAGDLAAKLVFEIDDDLWNIPAHNPVHALLGSQGAKALLARNAEVADLVTVTTHALAEVAQEYNDNVVVLPNMVPGSLLDIEHPPDGGPVTVVWGGSNTHNQDAGAASLAMRRVTQRTDCAFVIIGSDLSGVWGLPKERTTVEPWFDDVHDYLSYVARFDVGVAPLLDTPFNRCKSPLKVMEYMALGVPYVASKVGPYADFVPDGCGGFLAINKRQFAARLHDLILDQEMRITLAEIGRREARRFTVEANIHRFADAYNDLVGGVPEKV